MTYNFSTSIAFYLDLLFIQDKSNNITTNLHHKHDTFGFHIHVKKYSISTSIWCLCISAHSLFVAQIIVTFYDVTGLHS